MARRRPRNQRQEKPLLLILCEDQGGVKTYIEQIAKSILLRSAIAVDIQGIGEGPGKLYQYANMALRGSSRKFPNKADMVFLVFDKDRHESFDEVLVKSKNHDRIHLFASIPCIEMFFILHFQYCSMPANCYDDLLGVLKAIPEFKKYNKGSGSVPVAKMRDIQADALVNTDRLRTERRKTRSKNPMTDMDIFIEFLEDIATNGLVNIIGNNDQKFLHNDP